MQLKKGDKLLCKVNNESLELIKDCWYTVIKITQESVSKRWLVVLDYENYLDYYCAILFLNGEIEEYFFSDKELRKQKLNEIERR